MTEHTPGPWTVRLAGSQSGSTREIAQKQSREFPHPITVARMVSGTKDDARLIAAAPETAAERDRLRETVAELATAADDIAAELTDLMSDCWGKANYDTPAQQKLAAALARAKGESE